MNEQTESGFAAAIILAVAGATVFQTALSADLTASQAAVPKRADKHAPPAVPGTAAPVLPAADSGVERPASNAGFATTSAFAAPASGSVTPATALTPPVTITYAGSSDALSISDTGTGRGITVDLINTHDSNSAIYAQTGGKGAALSGKNGGTTGSAGKFLVTNAASTQAALFATTNGTGSAILATNTNADTNTPTIYGYNTTTADVGVGVEGQGGYVGVMGVTSDGSAVMGYTPSGGYGVAGNSNSGDGVYGYSFTGYGVYAQSVDSNALYAYTGSSTASIVAWNAGTGNGLYAYSANGIAGWFDGIVQANAFQTLSDRNAKTDFQPLDRADILEKVSRLPVTSWDFKTAVDQRHVGPMAQDFHAAFGLGGGDDKHINLSDLAGVSLAAIQELDARMKRKDAEIAELEARVARQAAALHDEQAAVADIRALAASMAARMAVLEGSRETPTPVATTGVAAAGAPGLAQ